MPKLTHQTRLLMALGKRGYAEVKRSNRYITVEYDPYEFYYLGQHGALRQGRTVHTSVPVSEEFKQELLAEIPEEMSGADALAIWDEVHKAAIS